MGRGHRWGALLAGLSLVACGPRSATVDEGSAQAAPLPSALASPFEPVRIDPPALPGALGADWAAGTRRPTLSWLEPSPSGGQRLRFAALSADGWTAPRTIVESDRFFANWADFPSLARSADGFLLAHWLERTGAGTYAYAVELARSDDGGESWRRLGPLHPEDPSETEHGFVSLVPQPTGPDGQAGIRAFWLDGREMAGMEEHGDGPSPASMTLRTARVTDRVEAGEALDPRICECCQTGAAMTTSGSVVFYRDRSADETRDVARVRRAAGGWSTPQRVHADNWKIPGCPVNGPFADARGAALAVAWMTGADPGPRVQIAFSSDGGESFGPPILVDGERPLGRVAMRLLQPREALVAWLALAGDGAELRLRRVTAEGALGEPRVVAAVTAARSGGFPRLVLDGADALVAWREVDGVEPAPRLRVARLAVDSIPPPPTIGAPAS